MALEDRRAALVAATEPLLERYGRDISTRQIADAAGVAEGTIFRAFATKDELIDTVIEEVFDESRARDAILAVDRTLPLPERLVAAVTIHLTGWTRADAVATLLIAALIVPRAFTLARDATVVLLEIAPAGLDLGDVRTHLLGVPGVTDVHDLHAWTITSGQPVLSAHVVVTDEALASGHGGRVLDALCLCLGDHFDLEHCTFQLESAGHSGHEHPVHD